MVSMVIAVSPRVLFNLHAAEISQRGSASATRGATAKPLVAEVCILTRSLVPALVPAHVL